MSAPRYNSAPETVCDFRSWYSDNLPLLERYFTQLNQEGGGPPDFFEWAVTQHEAELLVHMPTRGNTVSCDQRYRRYRTELRTATSADDQALARWMKQEGNRLGAIWVRTNPDGTTVEYECFLREQYAQAQGFFPLDDTTEGDDDHVDSNSTGRSDRDGG